MPANGMMSCAAYVAEARETAIQGIYRWAADLPAERQAGLHQPGRLQRITQLTFIDGYWRIRETTRLILQAIDTLSARQEHQAARFWIRHLGEEAEHDDVMLQDLAQMFGSMALAQSALQQHPISPPAAAMTGFFDWQTRHGNPHLLIILREFLENFVMGMTPEHIGQIHQAVEGKAEVLVLHQELDGGHAAECLAYIDQYFQPQQAGELVWAVHFIGACIRESQVWATQIAAMEAGEA